MIGKHIRFYVRNSTGATVEFGTDTTNNKFFIYGLGFRPVDGVWTPESTEETLFTMPATDLTDGSFAVGSEFTNTNNNMLYMCRAVAEVDNNSEGQFLVYWDWSTNPNTGGTYPLDSTNKIIIEDSHPCCRVKMAAAATQKRSRGFIIGSKTRF